MGQIRRIPRWLYLEDVLPADVLAEANTGVIAQFGHMKTPSPSFRNDTGYPIKLESLTVGQMYCRIPDTFDIAGFEDYLHFFWWGGFGARHEIEIGISGQDVNIVPAPVGVACADRFDQMCCAQNDQVGAPIKFEVPYILAKDNGLHFTFYSLRDRIRLNGDEAEEGFPTLARNGAVLAYGKDVETGYPVILSGNTEYLPMTNAGHDRYTCSSADLMNRGKNDVAIEEIVFTLNLAGTVEIDEGDPLVAPKYIQSLNYIRSGFFDAYHINPILGQPWMPGSLPIPIGMLAGRTFRGLTPRDMGPHVYTFPANSYLQRREELNVRVRRSIQQFREFTIPDTEFTTYGAVNQPVSVCLFGYLEVQ